MSCFCLLQFWGLLLCKAKSVATLTIYGIKPDIINANTKHLNGLGILMQQKHLNI